MYRTLTRRDSACEGDGRILARHIDTPLGEMLALADRQGLRLLEFADRRGLKREIARLGRRLHCTVVQGTNATLDAVEIQLGRYFAGGQLEFDLPLAPVGSAFQEGVWAALRRIPAGSTRSYAQIASEVGRPGAQRAVGRANGSNMISIVIPCHRVICADGSLSGYGGGVWRKRRLLDHERAFSRTAPGKSV
jgi:AraC family transcriptional regulator of adaptative response/methylated-DNA-[protein]-cysteine methyltransferase